MLLTSFAKTSQLPQKAMIVNVCVSVYKHVKVSMCLCLCAFVCNS